MRARRTSLNIVGDNAFMVPGTALAATGRLATRFALSPPVAQKKAPNLGGWGRAMRQLSESIDEVFAAVNKTLSAGHGVTTN